MAGVRAALTAALLASGPAGADVLGDWTDTTLKVANDVQQPPYMQSRTMTMVHVAMFEAINAVETRYAPYRVKATATPGTSAEGAAAVAAHDVLVSIFPGKAATLDAAQDIALVRVTDAAVRASSFALGQRIAAGILALRAADGWDAPNLWKPMTAPGVYIPTTLPLATSWGKVTPWVMEKGDQFHPAPPPPLNTTEWARDYNEVKSLGGRVSTARTPAQTEAANFWSVTGPAIYTAATRAVMSQPGRSLVQNARLLALSSMAQADALIAVFEAKYSYNLWRPITAIRDGDLDGNDATAPDLGWQPLIDTPMHPEYPCAHCISAGAVGAVLEKEFGTGKVRAFHVASPAVPKPRAWERIGDLVEEISNARVWAGVHYRNSTVVGTAMGRKIGELAWEKQLKPLR
jgi:hypothetical protein